MIELEQWAYEALVGEYDDTPAEVIVKKARDELGIDDETPIEENGRFSIKDMDGAEWVLRKKQDADDELAELESHAKKMKADIDEYLAKARARHTQASGFWDGLFTEYIHERGGAVRLLGGTVSLRKTTSLAVTDEEAAISWLHDEHPEAVRTKYEVDKAEAKKLVQAGAQVPGVQLVEKESVSVRTAK